MSAGSVMIELEPSLLAKLDGFVDGHLFRSRSDAVAVREKIERLESHAQFLAECQKLDPVEEQTFAEEWLDGERTAWKQARMVTVEIPNKADKPWMAAGGCLKDEPDQDAYRDAILEYRRQVDADSQR
jgi:Arc/MetJ-type ribon-helix-helix transcriptional regulator